MKKFFHIVAHKKNGAMDAKKLSSALGMAEDWMTYAPGAWILVSTEDGDVWRDRFGEFAEAVLVSDFIPDHTHWLLPDNISKWFEKHKMGFIIVDDPPAAPSRRQRR